MAPPPENETPKRLRKPHHRAKRQPAIRSSDEDTPPASDSDSSEAPAADAVPAAASSSAATSAAADVAEEEPPPPVRRQHAKARAHPASSSTDETTLDGEDSGDGQALEPVAPPTRRPRHKGSRHPHASAAASSSADEGEAVQPSESDSSNSGDGAATAAAQTDNSATTAAAWSPSRGKHLQRIEKDLSGLGDEDAPEETPRPKPAAESVQGALRGGWQSLMKGKKPKKKHSDPTTGIADLVQTPTAYTAWKPEQRSPSALTKSTKAELLAAEKAFSEFFLQLGISKRRSKSKEPAQWLSFERSSEGAGNNSPPANSDESAAAAVASLILERYARNLGSTALLQLSRARLTLAGLMGLWQRVQRDAAASASGHGSGAGGGGRHDDQTAKWCKDFQQDSELQRQQAEAAKEQAVTNLTEVKAERHMLQKEAQVQDRVLQVVGEGSRSLNSLLGRVTRRASSEALLIQKLQQQATALADISAGGNVANAVAGLREKLGRAEGYANSGGAEVEDLVRAAIKRRADAEKQLRNAAIQLRNRLQLLRKEEASLTAKANHPVTQQGSSLQQHYEQMCKWTLEDIQAREHKEEGERDAIRAALAVLNAPGAMAVAPGAVAVAPVVVAPPMSLPQDAPSQ